MLLFKFPSIVYSSVCRKHYSSTDNIMVHLSVFEPESDSSIIVFIISYFLYDICK